MKKNFFNVLLTVMALLLCISCVPKHTVRAYYLDYSHLTRLGIFVTESWSVPFDYDPVGSLFVEEYDGAKENKNSISEKNKDLFAPDLYKSGDSQNYVLSTPSSVLDSMAIMAKHIGADGIIGVKISPVKETTPGFAVSGMLIKRK